MAATVTVYLHNPNLDQLNAWGGLDDLPLSLDDPAWTEADAFGAPANGQVASTQLIQFPVANAAWGTVTGFAVCNAATGGNPLWYGQLTDSAGTPTPTPKNVTPGDIFQVPVGDLVLTLD